MATSQEDLDFMPDVHAAARRRFACPTGTAVSQGLSARGRTASRMACDAPHSPRRSRRRSQDRRAARSWRKTLGNRLYGSLSALLGIIPTNA